MSMPSMRSMSGTPPFRERLRQSYSNSPGPQIPFQQAPPQHSSFPPPQNRMSNKASMPKAPKPPEKPLMPYMRYSRKVWDSVKAKHPDMRLWEIGKVIGQMWRELPEAEKKEYNDAYEMDKMQYQDNLKSYHNSPQYQNYLREKQRAESMIEEEERRSKMHGNAEQRVSIQSADYEQDTDGGMSIKHVAAARYHRNHSLINEIFSDSVVPDGRTIVTEQRMMVLKKQVKSLTEHQQKLEKELNEINDKFEEKKRKFLESSEEFRKKLKEECDNKPVMTSTKFDSLVIKHKAELRVKYDKMIEQHKAEKEKAEKAAKASAAVDSQAEKTSVSVPTVSAAEENNTNATAVRESQPSEESVDTATKNDDQSSQDTIEEMDQDENEPIPTIEPVAEESQDSQATTIDEPTSEDATKREIADPPIDDDEDTLLSEPDNSRDQEKK